MDYTLRFKNKRYTLNKFTLEMQELVDKITASAGLATLELVECLWQFVVMSGVPTQDFNELLGGTAINDIDIRELEVLCVEIIKAYDERRNKAQSSKMTQEFNQMLRDNPKLEELSRNLAQLTNNLKG